MSTRKNLILSVASVGILVMSFIAIAYYFLELNPPDDPEVVEQQVEGYLEYRYNEEFEVTYEGYNNITRNVHLLEAFPVDNKDIIFSIDQNIESGNISERYQQFKWEEMNMDEKLPNEVDTLFPDAYSTDFSLPYHNQGINTEITLSSDNNVEWNEEEERIYGLVEFYEQENIYGVIQVKYENLDVVYDLDGNNNDFENINYSQDVAGFQQDMDDY